MRLRSSQKSVKLVRWLSWESATYGIRPNIYSPSAETWIGWPTYGYLQSSCLSLPDVTNCHVLTKLPITCDWDKKCAWHNVDEKVATCLRHVSHYTADTVTRSRNDLYELRNRFRLQAWRVWYVGCSTAMKPWRTQWKESWPIRLMTGLACVA